MGKLEQTAIAGKRTTSFFRYPINAPPGTESRRGKASPPCPAPDRPGGLALLRGKRFAKMEDARRTTKVPVIAVAAPAPGQAQGTAIRPIRRGGVFPPEWILL